MRLDSLRLRLVLWLLLPLAGVASVNIGLTYRTALATAASVTERSLEASARSIAEQASADRGVVEAPIPPAAIEMFDTGFQDIVYYRVEGHDGRLLTGYPDLPMPAHAVPPDEPAVYDGIYRDQPLRLVALSHEVVGSGAKNPILVVVGVTLRSEAAMGHDLWIGSLGQQGALLMVAAILALLGLRQGLAPLMRLRDAVVRRGQTDLDPLPDLAVQSELRPLVAALNQYLERMRAQMAAQRRFVANAAHQLKTPLALLTMQATFALRADKEAERIEALTAIEAGTRQTGRLASQLLTLSRAEPGSRRPRQDAVDLVEAARAILVAQAPRAMERDIEIGLEEDGAAWVEGDATMLREMIVNLVDNALRYTPPGGAVTVSVGSDGEGCVLLVADTGPGIPEAERLHVLEPFYRILGTESEGSGLGLAIVREVAEAAGGTVSLGDPPAGTGLVVEVRLPTSPASTSLGR